MRSKEDILSGYNPKNDGGYLAIDTLEVQIDIRDILAGKELSAVKEELAALKARLPGDGAVIVPASWMKEVERILGTHRDPEWAGPVSRIMEALSGCERWET